MIRPIILLHQTIEQTVVVFTHADIYDKTIAFMNLFEILRYIIDGISISFLKPRGWISHSYNSLRDVSQVKLYAIPMGLIFRTCYNLPHQTYHINIKKDKFIIYILCFLSMKQISSYSFSIFKFMAFQIICKSYKLLFPNALNFQKINPQQTPINPYIPCQNIITSQQKYINSLKICLTNLSLFLQMDQINLKDQLLMKQQQPQRQKGQFQLLYQPIQTEGECILKSVNPIKKKNFRFAIFCILSVIFLGIPVVLAYWQEILINLGTRNQNYGFILKNAMQDFAHILQFQTTMTKLQQFRKSLKNIFRILQDNINSHQKTLTTNKYIQEKKAHMVYFFINRYMKYRIMNSQAGIMVKADIFDYEQNIKNMVKQNYTKNQSIKGYEDDVVVKLRQRFGPGVMIIQRPGLFILFMREIVQPLYFFIVTTLLIWTYEQYYYYCMVIFATTAIGIIVNLYQTYTLNNKIFDMAYYETQVNVLRKKVVVNISSKDVVPGDIVFLKDPIKIPFDGLILQNSALLNQCALTGQSVPIVRKAQDLRELQMLTKSNKDFKISLKNNLICEGTTLIQVDSKKPMKIFQIYRQSFGVPVYVIRTNFVTLKGQLIRLISFPIEKQNIFEKQSSKFLLFLFCLACISYALLIIRLYKYVQLKDMIIKFLDLITITVPPGLPVSMTFGIIHAIQKLKKKDIYCVSPNKVILGGLVDMICFDKTGTLTQDFMDFKSLIPANKGMFSQQINNPLNDPNYPKQTYNLTKLLENYVNINLDHVLTNMASNHTITNILSTGQNVGDPMELKLFQFGQYFFIDQFQSSKNFLHPGQVTLFNFQNKRGHYGSAVRRMDFDAQLLRMSVITKSSINKDYGSYYLYTKGSPESIFKICKTLSIPRNYEQVLKYNASSGYRVLAICHKKLNQYQLNQQRSQLQIDMEFDGFQIFHNKLKPQSRGAVKQLINAKIPCLMITGDNALTGCNMSYKSGIINIKKKLYVYNYKMKQKIFQSEEFRYDPTLEQINQDKAELEQHHDSDQEIHQDIKQMELRIFAPQKSKKNNNSDLQVKIDGGQMNQADFVKEVLNKIMGRLQDPKNQICLTGSAFNLLYGGIDLRKMDDSRKKILKQTKVYARAKPNDKARIIMAYQQGLGKIVSMCGDGANDCGALKQSDAGLSISQTQASISAPFTSKVTNVGSMVQLIKQCRAGLVTNFSLFNIMALYSLIQYTSAVICQYYFTYPSDFGFLYWDLFGNFFFFLVFGYTQTADRLSKQKPSRSLFTITNLLQVGIMYLLQLFGQLLMIFSLSNFFVNQIDYWSIGGSQKNHQGYIQNDNDFLLSTIQGSIIFLFSNFMYVFSFIAFSISKPWRKQFYTNIPFMIVFVISFGYSVIMLVLPKARIDIFQIVHMDNHVVNLFVLISALVIGSIMYINQKCILEPISNRLRIKNPNNPMI